MSPARSTWPVVLLLGVCVSLLMGVAAAVAAPSEDGRPWWHSDRPERVTGTIVDVDRDAGTVTLQGLVTYDPVRAGIGALTIDAPDSDARPGDTVDVVIRRDRGEWVLDSLQQLDPD